MPVQVTDGQPSTALRAFVQGYKLIESDQNVVNQLLPDTCMALAFRLNGEVCQLDGRSASSLPVSTVSGLRSTMREMRYQAGARTLVVLLSPSGAARLFNRPLHLFYNDIVDLQEVAPDTNELQQKLLSARDFYEQIRLIETYLTKRILSHTHDAAMAEAVRIISAMRGVVRVRALSSTLCLSQDAFEKRFRRSVGASPKQFANIVRMRAVVQHNASEIAQITYDLGFYDPAHFTKSFKQFTGKTPTDFFKAPSPW